MLWSVKESVYKYVKRIEPTLIFSPTRIVATRLENVRSFYTASVSLAGAVYYTRSYITHDYINTIASADKDFPGVQQGLRVIDKEDYAHQSAAVRSLLKGRLDAVFPGTLWTIEKGVEGYPLLFKDDKPSGIAVSFAHHGRFVGYSYAHIG